MRRLAALRTSLAATSLFVVWTVASAGCASEGEEVGEAPRSRGGYANESGAGGKDGELPPEGSAGEAGADQTGSGGSTAGNGGTDSVGVGGGVQDGGAGGDTSAGGAETTAGGASAGAPPVDPNACVPGTSQVVGACGKCGQATRVCGANGLWGNPACAGEGACTPGQVDTAECGDCGEKKRTCTAACQWPASYGACGGEGVCKPGATKGSGACDPCQVVTCNAQCKWGSTCKLKAGAACTYEEGTHFRCCGNDKWQFCGSNCEYHPCAACTSAGCRAECD